MATPNVVDIIRMPGQLCFGPTDLSLDFPHGGTALGVIKSIVAKPRQTYYNVKAEEWGGEVAETIKGGESWVLGGLLRSFDKDALRILFPASIEGAETQKTVIEHPAANTAIRAGNLLSASGIKLLFSPDDTIRIPFVLFRNAIPMIEETALMNIEIDQDWTVPFLFAAIRDSSTPAKAVAMGFRGDFSL